MRTIRELREARGLTRLQLANMIGVTPGSVYGWERGTYQPRARQLIALAHALGVPAEQIRLLDPPRTGPPREEQRP